MKKLLCVMLSVIMIIAFVGCGSDTKEQETTKQQVTTSSTKPSSNENSTKKNLLITASSLMLMQINLEQKKILQNLITVRHKPQQKRKQNLLLM